MGDVTDIEGNADSTYRSGDRLVQADLPGHASASKSNAHRCVAPCNSQNLNLLRRCARQKTCEAEKEFENSI